MGDSFQYMLLLASRSVLLIVSMIIAGKLYGVPGVLLSPALSEPAELSGAGLLRPPSTVCGFPGLDAGLFAGIGQPHWGLGSNCIRWDSSRMNAGGDTAIDVVIVSYNTIDFLRSCLQSVNVAQSEMARVCARLSWTNASSDGSPEMVAKEYPSATANPAGHEYRIRSREQPEGLMSVGISCESRALAQFPMRSLLRGRCRIWWPILKRIQPAWRWDRSLFSPTGLFRLRAGRFPSPLRNFWNLSGLQARFSNHLRVLQNWFSESEHVTDVPVDMVSGACFLARREYMESIGALRRKTCSCTKKRPISFLPARKRGLKVGFCAEAVVIHGKGGSTDQSGLREFSLYHACRSKYYCFRKHYGALASRTTYWSDCAVLGLSAIVAKLRGKENLATRKLAIYRRAYRESFLPFPGAR